MAIETIIPPNTPPVARPSYSAGQFLPAVGTLEYQKAQAMQQQPQTVNPSAVPTTIYGHAGQQSTVTNPNASLGPGWSTSNPNQTTTASTSTSSQPLNSYNAGVNDVNATTNALSTKFNEYVNNFQNGTIPLNGYEAAQVEATKQSFNSLIETQSLANKNYEGGVAVQNENMGLSRYSPTMAAGNVLAAVSEGNKRVADLNVKMSLAVSTMQSGFQENNYKRVKEAYDSLIQAQRDKTTQLEKSYAVAKEQEKLVKEAKQEQILGTAYGVIQNEALTLEERQKKLSEIIAEGGLNLTQLKEVQGTMRQFVQDDIKNKMDDRNFTYREKQDAIDNAYKNGILSETQRHNMATEAIAKSPTPKEVKETVAALKEAKASIPVMKDKMAVLDTLSSHPGMNTRVGTGIMTRAPAGFWGGVGKIPTYVAGLGIPLMHDVADKLSGAGQDFAGSVHQATGGLTLQTLIEAKARGATFGALSDAELSLLSAAATKINDWEVKERVNGIDKGIGIWDINEASFKTELKTIKDLTARALLLSGESLITADEDATLNAAFPAQEAVSDPSVYY